MRLLLDTHALIWAAQEPELLPAVARTAIADERNAIYVSAVTAMEIATKFRLGKLDVSPTLAEHFVEEVESQGFIILALNGHHAQRGGLLSIPHKDPFDRLLIAQSMIEGMTLVSNEELFDEWFVPRLWSKPLFKE
ncbi:MAG TPA: type II toxin-antitoxin system VapC family toxin [Allosphingosinicella sp.]|nr:type II toxin-antitoxin system VapC family toxin [Allosphingosinicella sp.]